MRSHPATRPFHGETGGITILVVLLLLVLLTIVAVGMSRDSFREIVITGTSRQGAMVRNESDTGLEWSLYWMTAENFDTGGTEAASKALITTIKNLKAQAESAGIPQTINPVGAMINSQPGRTDQFSLVVMRMGKLEFAGNDQISVKDWRLWPDMWSIRANSQVNYTAGLTFLHSKESWLSTPVR